MRNHFAAVFFSRSSVRFSSRSLAYLVSGLWSCKQCERWGPFYELSLKSNHIVVGYSHNLFCRQVIIDMSCHLCYWTWPFCLLWDEISKLFWFSFLWWLRMLNFSSKYSSATWVSSVENSMYTYMPLFSGLFGFWYPVLLVFILDISTLTYEYLVKILSLSGS